MSRKKGRSDEKGSTGISGGKVKKIFTLLIMQSEEYNLASLVLPTGILEYFSITKISQTEDFLHIFLEEKNIKPAEFANSHLTSKGFFDEIKVQDFPIRGKDVFLFIKRRRWLNEVGLTVFRNWELVAKGTRITKEFAAFLKVISRFQTS